MKSSTALLCLDLAVIACATAEGNRPRGVGPEFAKFYKNPETFTCISNPSIVLPFASVNDDYCDCPDGSDEPGTAACAHLSPLSPRTPADIVPGADTASLALPGYYCKNKGHMPSYVPFTNVNDGVCDYKLCCDGSDEWEHVGGVKCEDRCSKLGKEWRRQDESRQKAYGVGIKKRKDLVAEAAKLKAAISERIQTLSVKVDEGNQKVKRLERELADAERQDRGKVVKGPSAKAGKLGVLIGLAKQRTDELRSSLSRVREERDSGWTRLKELEALLTTFKEEYNPNFNDEGVKRAVRAWEDYAARDKTSPPDAAHDRDLDAITKEDKENGLDWDEYEGDDGSETDVLYEIEKYLPPSVRGWVDSKLRDFRVMLIDNGILADNSKSSESKVVIDARSKVDDAKREVDDAQKSLNSDKEDLVRDFGPDDVFRALKGQCVSQDSGEYIYELCFMDKTMQKQRKGGGHTNMGNYVRLETVIVDDELPADGKGLGSGPRIALKYENGQHCWNGPSRSTTAILACSETNEIWKIMEEEKCVYRMEVGTPAVCEAKSGKASDSSHPEL